MGGRMNRTLVYLWLGFWLGFTGWGIGVGTAILAGADYPLSQFLLILALSTGSAMLIVYEVALRNEIVLRGLYADLAKREGK